jgi:hypothetical protein
VHDGPEVADESAHEGVELVGIDGHCGLLMATRLAANLAAGRSILRRANGGVVIKI